MHTVQTIKLLAQQRRVLQEMRILFAQQRDTNRKRAFQVQARWYALCEAQAWDEFIAELLERHYDPAYNKSMRGNYSNYGRAYRLTLNSPNKEAFSALAHEVLALPGDFVNNGGTV